MASQLTQQLIKHIDEGIAMEQSVLRMLDSMARTARDDEMQRALEQHKRTTQRHIARLQERLKANGGSQSRVKQAGGAATAGAKRVFDVARRQSPARDARDGFATEQMEVAGYELLERIARRAGDAETADVAKQNRAEDAAMAKTISDKWDAVVDVSLGNGQQRQPSAAKERLGRVGRLAGNPLVIGAASVGAGLLAGRRLLSRGESPPSTGEAESLQLLTKQELQQRAEKRGIPVRRSMTKQELIEALESKPGGGRPPQQASPFEVQKFLEGVGYPTSREDLVSEASRQGADERVRATLKKLPKRRFQTPAEVSEAIGGLTS